MIPESLNKHLTHTVQLRQVTGTSDYAEDSTQFYKELPCLVDTASGRRKSYGEAGEVVSFDFAVSFNGDVVLNTGDLLLNAKDHKGNIIFSKASIDDVRPYRHPKHGITGYLVLARSRE